MDIVLRTMVSSIKVFRYNRLIVFITTTKLQERDMSLQLQYDSTDLNLQKSYVKEAHFTECLLQNVCGNVFYSYPVEKNLLQIQK